MNKNLNEANRCLSCKVPLCKKHCPVSTDIPYIIELYKKGEIDKAGKTLFENNPLSIFCSILCPHEDQCRGNCIKGIKDKPVDFPEIEREISTYYLDKLEIEKKESNGIKVAIIGGGASGITASIYLAKEGYDITIFEAFPKIGGVLRYGIPEFRLSRELVDKYELYLRKLGVKIKTNTLMGIHYSIEELKRDGFEYIIIGTGTWNPKSMGIEGETLPHVHYAINYLVSPENYDLGDNVLVIGGGNVAMDASRTAKNLGSKNVTVVYRRGEEDMPATTVEIEEAKKEGVEFKYYLSPLKILDNEMLFNKTISYIDENGDRKLKIDRENIENMNYSSVIVAVSQESRRNLVSSEKNLKLEDWGTIRVKDNFETTLDNVFACGDVVTGPRTVVAAVRDTKLVVEEILKKSKI